ncbi:hypothetical protein ACWEQC_10175 [Streptomyces shenzhenensis]
MTSGHTAKPKSLCQAILVFYGAPVHPRAGPRAERALDEGRLTARGGVTVGLPLTADGLGCAMLPGLMGVLSAAALIGAGTDLITPLGFAALTSSAPQVRLDQTMGAADLGHKPGDAEGRCWSRSSPR